MKKFFEYIKENISKKVYVGNCISCLDDDWFTNNIASDATELAQAVENSKPISYNEFNAICDVPRELKIKPHVFDFAANNDIGLVWAYDTDKDIHYFFK